MNVRQAEFLGASALIALIVFGFYQTSLIDLTLSSELETFTGPRAYPRIILSGMLLLAFVHTGKLLFTRKEEIAQDTALPAHPRLTRVLLALLTLVILAFVLEPVGYLITLVPFLIAIGFLNGATSPAKTALFSIIASAICLVVFRYGLNTVLPEGLLGIDQIF